MTQESYAVPLHASAPETVDGNSGVVNFPPKDAAVVLNITAIGGTLPTLDVVIEEYDPVSDTYFIIDTFPQQNSATKVRRVIAAVLGGNIRGRWTIGGSAGQTFTFSLSALGKPN